MKWITRMNTRSTIFLKWMTYSKMVQTIRLNKSLRTRKMVIRRIMRWRCRRSIIQQRTQLMLLFRINRSEVMGRFKEPTWVERKRSFLAMVWEERPSLMAIQSSSLITMTSNRLILTKKSYTTSQRPKPPKLHTPMACRCSSSATIKLKNILVMAQKRLFSQMVLSNVFSPTERKKASSQTEPSKESKKEAWKQSNTQVDKRTFYSQMERE